jgi:hypothetical protein
MMGCQRNTPGVLDRERPGTHCRGSWEGTRAGLEKVRKISPHRDWIHGPSSQWRVAIPTELSRPINWSLISTVKCNNRLGQCHRTWDCLPVATELPPSKPSIYPCRIQALYLLKYTDLFGSCD